MTLSHWEVTLLTHLLSIPLPALLSPHHLLVHQAGVAGKGVSNLTLGKEMDSLIQPSQGVWLVATLIVDHKSC